MFISERTRNLGTENAFVVLAEVNKLVAQGKNVVNFCIGQPDFDTPKNIKEAAKKAIDEGKTGYTPSAGIPALREAIARMFSRSRGIDVKPEDVVAANGAKPFIAFTIAAVTDYGKGHEVLYPNPGFPIYDAQIRAQGAVPVALPLHEAKGFVFDIDDLAGKLNDRSRLLILNSPQNPTGGVLSRAELEQIAKIVARYPTLWLVSDEVYERMVFDGTFQSIAMIPGMPERTVILDGCSKTYAMTGWRMGYVANHTLAPYFATWMTNTESCPSHPVQYAAIEALSGPQDEADKMMASFHKRRDVIVPGLNRIEGVSCKSPGGAFYAWPNVTEACKMTGCESAEEFRKLLLYDAGVAVLADIHFGPSTGEGNFIRFSYAASVEMINEGLSRMADCIKKNAKTTAGAKA